MADLELEAGFEALLMEAATAMQAFVTDVPFARSQELVPRDTETLANSGTVSDVVYDGETATVVIGYGSSEDHNPKGGEPSAAYAVIVHENLSLNHPNGGESKFLEKAVLEAAGDFAPGIRARMGG